MTQTWWQRASRSTVRLPGGTGGSGHSSDARNCSFVLNRVETDRRNPLQAARCAPGTLFLMTTLRMARLERQITVAAVVLPFLGFIVALWLLWGGAVTGLDLAILAVMYVLVGFGVTIGFHRCFTHRSFEAKPWLRGTLAILGSMSVQGAVIHWVADHRKHHTFTDEEGDPHSPHTNDAAGWRGVLRGLWHSHMGWLFDGERSSARRFAPDLRKDPLIRKIDTLFPVWALLGLAIPAVAGFILSGFEPIAALTAFVWAGLVRVFLLHHATWSVNSICHMYGKRPFETEDESRNNWARRVRVAGRGLAPHPPRLPDLGAPRPPAPASSTPPTR